MNYHFAGQHCFFISYISILDKVNIGSLEVLGFQDSGLGMVLSYFFSSLSPQNTEPLDARVVAASNEKNFVFLYIVII